MLDMLREDLKQAMKDKDKVRKEIIQLVRGNIKNFAIEKRVAEEDLSVDDILSVISKELKQQNDSLEAFKLGNRADLVEDTERKIEILKSYLPKQLGKEEIEVIVKETMAALCIETLTNKDKGRLMKELMPKVKGKADGKLVNDIVSSLTQA